MFFNAQVSEFLSSFIIKKCILNSIKQVITSCSFVSNWSGNMSFKSIGMFLCFDVKYAIP